MIDLGKWLNGEYVISDPILPDPDAPASHVTKQTESPDRPA